MTDGITMERRTEFRAKLRKPKSELWLGCVVKSVVKGVSKARGMPYVKVYFENCPFVLIVNPYDLMNAEKIAREYSMTPPTGIEVGELLNLNVSWRKTPDWAQEKFKLGEWEPLVRLELRSWIGIPDSPTSVQMPVAMEQEGNISWARRLISKLMEWF